MKERLISIGNSPFHLIDQSFLSKTSKADLTLIGQKHLGKCWISKVLSKDNRHIFTGSVTLMATLFVLYLAMYSREMEFRECTSFIEIYWSLVSLANLTTFIIF